MAKKSVSDLVTEVIQPIVTELGYELVEVKYQKGFGGMELNLFIYSPNGITIDDCEKVSKAIDQPLDDLNPTNDTPYTLNVSSLGIDRPVKTEADARRNVGTKLDVKLFAPKDGKKVWTGKLVDYSRDGIVIEVDGELKAFLFSEIALASPVIEF